MEDPRRRVRPRFDALLAAAAAEPRTVHSRHFDELDLSGWESLSTADAPAFWRELLAHTVTRLEEMKVAGVMAGIVVPLKISDTVPAVRDLQRGWDFLVPLMDERQPPSVYVFPVDALGKWELDVEDYRFPLAGEEDNVFVRYWRDADEIAAEEEYTAAVYLLRAV